MTFIPHNGKKINPIKRNLHHLTVGKTANYAVVMAQLYTQGRCHGPHPFIVQLRDEDTHHSLPGECAGTDGLELLPL